MTVMTKSQRNLVLLTQTDDALSDSLPCRFKRSEYKELMSTHASATEPDGGLLIDHRIRCRDHAC